MPGSARRIKLDFVWNNQIMVPDDQNIISCDWSPGRYPRETRKEIEHYKSEFAQTPSMYFHLEFKDPRWLVERYRILIGYVAGHNHDVRDLDSACQWYTWEDATVASDSVDVDKPWHLIKNFTAPTTDFLPPQRNNPKGKITVCVSICRNGKERDLSERNGAFKPRADKPESPLARYVFKVNFNEISAGRGAAGRDPQRDVSGLGF